MNIESLLRKNNLRITKPRLVLGSLVFSKHPTHWTAETLFDVSNATGNCFSLATVYNTLNQFADKGILRRIQLQGNLCYYDTNLEPHHHIYHTVRRESEDVPTDSIVTSLPFVTLHQKTPPDIIIHAHTSRASLMFIVDHRCR